MSEKFGAFVVTGLQVWHLEEGEGSVGTRRAKSRGYSVWTSQNADQSWIRMNKSKVPVPAQELGFRSWIPRTDFLEGCGL